MTGHHLTRLFGHSCQAYEDRGRFDKLCERENSFAPKSYMLRYGDPLKSFPVLLEGWAVRYQILPDGSRQIVSLMLPGDTCHYGLSPDDVAPDEIVAVSRCRVAWVSQARFASLMDECPAINHAFQDYGRLTAAIQTSWIINMGRRNAVQRMAHFLCESYRRLADLTVADPVAIDFPLTQEDLADILGLTPVHVNRKLQELRRADLILLEGKRLQLLDYQRLRQIAGFDRVYLGESRHTEAARLFPEVPARIPASGMEALERQSALS